MKCRKGERAFQAFFYPDFSVVEKDLQSHIFMIRGYLLKSQNIKLVSFASHLIAQGMLDAPVVTENVKIDITVDQQVALDNMLIHRINMEELFLL